MTMLADAEPRTIQDVRRKLPAVSTSGSRTSASAIAVALLEESLWRGNTITFPSIGVVLDASAVRIIDGAKGAGDE